MRSVAVALSTLLAAVALAPRAVAQATSPRDTVDDADDDDEDDDVRPRANLNLELPLFDAPFNLQKTGPYPSMAQSLAVTKDLYELALYGTGRIADPEQRGWPGFGARLLAFGALAVGMKIPFGEAWLHEEWHRAVMAHRGISSHNGVYDHHGSLVPVNHVTDEDLIRLKRDHVADLVRLDEAGMEAEHQLALAIETDVFFRDTRLFHQAPVLFSHISTSGYLFTCASNDSAKETRKQNDGDGTDVAERDFTGLDCDGWVYDLFRPKEPYEERGPHPSGVGIDRYRTWPGLSGDERRFLELQARLSLLNLVDPFAFVRDPGGIREAGDRLRYTANLRHHLTSYGYALSTNVFARHRDLGMLTTLSLGFNHERSFPGVDVTAVDLPLRWLPDVGGGPLVGQLRGALWLQPEAQDFYTTRSSAGGLASARVGTDPRRGLAPYLEVEGKTPGWVAGNVYLDRNVSTRLGVSAIVF
jgi:hypothetical protein